MIGIIGAMEIEVKSLIEKITVETTENFSGITYVSGKMFDTDIVVAQCGIGKVNAAVCAQTMILKYSPQIIINTGVAGSVCDSVGVYDIVIGEKTVQHDLDLSPIGMERVYISCTPEIVKRLANSAAGKYHIGTIATGDQFINCGEIKSALSKEFSAIACEMESASIAHVCTLNNVDFGIVRTISDNANDDSAFDFNRFLQEAAEKSVKIICEFLKT